jgi:hypothetical protein
LLSIRTLIAQLLESLIEVSEPILRHDHVQVYVPTQVHISVCGPCQGGTLQGEERKIVPFTELK